MPNDNPQDPAENYSVDVTDADGTPDQPVVEGELNENPDDQVGEEVAPEHDLDPDKFDGDDFDDDEDGVAL